MKIYEIKVVTKERKLGEKLNEDINIILSSWKRKERAILSQKEMGGAKKPACKCPCSPKKKKKVR